MAVGSDKPLKRRWPYQAMVMKVFETTSNPAAMRPSCMCSFIPEKCRQCPHAAGAFSLAWGLCYLDLTHDDRPHDRPDPPAQALRGRGGRGPLGRGMGAPRRPPLRP